MSTQRMYKHSFKVMGYILYMRGERGMDKELYLTDLIDEDALQMVADVFSKTTDLSALITDDCGIKVVESGNFPEFCRSLIRKTKEGATRCEVCEQEAKEQGLQSKELCRYDCHAGLTNMTVPIMAGDIVVGRLVVGPIALHPISAEQMEQLADDLQLDANDCKQAFEQIRVLEEKNIQKVEESVSGYANMLSHMAYSRHLIYMGNLELEKVARMKSDFLANMSHEIRTPMNAVIGMAEMALRENLSPAAEDYINQIVSSGKTLLTIINDILDFSKIESGKMDIIPVEYAPVEAINDVVNIIATRIGEKDLELIVDIPVDLPAKLYGDETRIKQIVTNLANNAVKFTQKGKVHIRVWYDKVDEENIMLHAAIEDTGMGIKKHNLNMLFQSFQQLDSKRNRNIEGTGLGLAISKQLLVLMDGDIQVESEYEKGSTFSFSIPQKVVSWEPSVTISDEDRKVLIYINNSYVKEQMVRDLNQFGITSQFIESADELAAVEDADYLFMDVNLLSEKVEFYLGKHPNLNAIMLMNARSMEEYSISNLRVVRKPCYSYTLGSVFMGRELRDTTTKAFEDFDFIAPTANVLVVDDNEVNLTVAKGLLKPLQMNIETALSGMEAVEKISRNMYDLIFMDHMMPELDGVEVTRIIRRLHPECSSVPIIALTANVVDGTREMFIAEEMNDLVAKPIDVKVITDKVRQWLPDAKIERVDVEEAKKAKKEAKKQQSAMIVEDSNREIPFEVGDLASGLANLAGLDTQQAIAMLGTEELYWDVLKDYYHCIERKALSLKQLEKDENWEQYTIEVHALKSASRQIGAMELGNLAQELELAGKCGDYELIKKQNNKLLADYLLYELLLKEYFPEKEKLEEQIEEDVLKMHLMNLKVAAADMDVDSMDAIVEELENYDFKGKEKEYFESLQMAVQELDCETCESTIELWNDFMDNAQ